MKKYLSILLILIACTFMCEMALADPPANNSCDNAFDAETLSTGVTVQLGGDNTDATNSCPAFDDPEVWVKFSLPTCMNVTIDFCENDPVREGYYDMLFTDCPCDMGDEFYAEEYSNCWDDNPSLTWNNLQAGTYYYAIESYNEIGAYTVNITGVDCPLPPANDDCSAADDAGTLSPGVPVQLTGDNTAATNDCYSLYNPEVWIQFTLTSCMDVTIDYCGTDPRYYEANRQLFDTCPCDAGNNYYSNYEGSCPEPDYNPVISWYNLQAGTYYYPIKSDGYMSYGPYVVNVIGVDCPPPPTNDNCGDAIAVGEIADLAFSTRGATYDGAGSCISSGANIWYVYTPTFTGNARVSLCGSEYNTMLAVYDGAGCAPLPTELACNDEHFSCAPASRVDIPVVMGNDYLMEIGGLDESGNGLLNISEAPEPPPNDDCANADDAETLSSGVTVQLTGDNTEATPDCAYLYDPEVWVKFAVVYRNMHRCYGSEFYPGFGRADFSAIARRADVGTFISHRNSILKRSAIRGILAIIVCRRRRAIDTGDI